MKFKLLFLILLFLVPIVYAENLEFKGDLIDDNEFINLNGDNLIIDGYKYKTIVNVEELNTIFTVLDIRIGTRGRPTGELIIGDLYFPIKGDKVKTKKYTYGVIAGNIKTNVRKSQIKILPIDQNKGIYYNFGKNNNGLKSDEIILTKKEVKRLNYGYVLAESNGGNYLQNDYILTCKNCNLTLNQMKKIVDVEGEGKLMKKETYKNEYKNVNQKEIEQLGPEKIVKIKNIARLQLTKEEYQFTNKFDEPRVHDQLDFKIAGFPNTQDSWIGEIRLKSLFSSIEVGIIDPFEKYTINYPVYIIQATNLIISKIPEHFVSHLELEKYKTSHKILIIDENTPLFTLNGGMLVFKKNVRSDVKCLTKEFNWFNCFDLNTATKKIYIKLQDTKNEFSPLDKNKKTITKDSDIILYNHLNYNDLEISPINDINSNLKLMQPSLLLESKFQPFTKFDNQGYKVSPNSNWYNFGTSFTTFAYNNKNANGKIIYDKIRCELNTQKCYLNGEEISKNTKIINCENNSFCPNGEICINNKCHKKINYKELIRGSSKKPIKLIFVSDNIEETELKNIVNNLLYHESTNDKGLLKLEPFESNKDLFGVFYLATKGLPYSNLKKAPTLNQRLISELSGMNYIVTISKIKFQSFALTSTPPTTHISISGFPLTSSDRATFVHELGGHLIGNLRDEYLILESGNKGQTFYKPNCAFSTAPDYNKASAKSAALKKWSELIGENAAKNLVEKAIKNNWWGCGGECDEKYCSNNLRQAEDSIMNSHKGKYAVYWGPISEAIIKNRLNEYRGKI